MSVVNFHKVKAQAELKGKTAASGSVVHPFRKQFTHSWTDETASIHLKV